MRQAFDTAPVKEKLNNLRAHLPTADEYTCCFARFVATRLNPQLVPIGFIMACQLAIHDLAKGIDGFTNKPIDRQYGKILDMPPFFYNMFNLQIPLLAQAVLSEADAAEVQQELIKIREEMKKKAPN